MVPETYDPVSHTFKHGGSSSVVCSLICVLPPISLNNQFGFYAYKINNVRFNYCLASKLISIQSTAPQLFP